MNWEVSPAAQIRYENYQNVMNMNVEYMKSIGFNMDEINALKRIMPMDRQLTTTYLTACGFNPEQARRMHYLYKVAIGDVTIDSKDDLCKHLKKLFGAYKLGIQDLAISSISKVPRVAVIAGIKVEPFTIYNSQNYRGTQMLYQVEHASSKSILIRTTRKPVIKYKGAKKIPGLLEIKEVGKHGDVLIAIDKKYARLCNRFIILASFRRPELHHGMYEIICFEGSRIYVYADTMGVRESVKYSSNSQRVYDYGYFPNEIAKKLNQVTQVLFARLHGQVCTGERATKQYYFLDPVRQDYDFEDGVEV